MLCFTFYLVPCAFRLLRSVLRLRNLNFVTLNVRGLNCQRNRCAIFRQLHEKNASIIFLQETYSSSDQEKKWSNDWVSKIYFLSWQ